MYFVPIVLHIYASSPMSASSIVAVRANAQACGPIKRLSPSSHLLSPVSFARLVCQKCQFCQALLEQTYLSRDEQQSLNALLRQLHISAVVEDLTSLQGFSSSTLWVRHPH